MPNEIIHRSQSPQGGPIRGVVGARPPERLPEVYENRPKDKPKDKPCKNDTKK